MSNVCFVDTETTGLDPDRHEIWEVGLIRPNGAEHLWQLPVDLGRADPIVLNIGKFHDRRLADIPLDDEWSGLDQVLLGQRSSAQQFVVPAYELPRWAATFVDLTRGLHLVGACVSFDTDRLWRLIRTVGECPMWHYHSPDVEALAAGYVSAQSEGEGLDGTKGTIRVERPDGTVNHIDGRPPWNSNDLSRAVGVNPDDFDRHTALGDARWAKEIYEAVMAP